MRNQTSSVDSRTSYKQLWRDFYEASILSRKSNNINNNNNNRSRPNLGQSTENLQVKYINNRK